MLNASSSQPILLPKPPLAAGLNHNVRHNGRVYHVQTECHTVRGARSVQSIVFHEGAVLYQTREACGETTTDPQPLIAALHKRAMIRVFSGRLEKAPEKPPVLAPAEAARPAPKRGVDKARALLVDLAQMSGMNGMGVFGRDGQAVSFLAAGALDLPALGKAYGEAWNGLCEAAHQAGPGELQRATLRTSEGLVIFVGFAPLLDPAHLPLLDALNHVLVVLAPDTAPAPILERLDAFMRLIVEQLRDFAATAVRAG